MNLTRTQRQIVLTAIVAAVGAIFSEHALKPYMKGKLRV